jgi:hypothetical protein
VSRYQRLDIEANQIPVPYQPGSSYPRIIDPPRRAEHESCDGIVLSSGKLDTVQVPRRQVGGIPGSDLSYIVSPEDSGSAYGCHFQNGSGCDLISESDSGRRRQSVKQQCLTNLVDQVR